MHEKKASLAFKREEQFLCHAKFAEEHTVIIITLVDDSSLSDNWYTGHHSRVPALPQAESSIIGILIPQADLNRDAHRCTNLLSLSFRVYFFIGKIPFMYILTLQANYISNYFDKRQDDREYHVPSYPMVITWLHV